MAWDRPECLNWIECCRRSVHVRVLRIEGWDDRVCLALKG